MDASGNSQLGYGSSFGIWAKAGNINDSGDNFAICASIVYGNFGSAIYGSSGAHPGGVSKVFVR